MNKTAGQGLRTLLALQVGMLLGMAILCAMIDGLQAFYSSLLAGVCCMIATTVFGLIVLKKTGARAAKEIVRAFYRAEAIKWLVTAVLMMLIFEYIPITALAFFITFAVMQLSYLVAMGLVKQ